MFVCQRCLGVSVVCVSVVFLVFVEGWCHICVVLFCLVRGLEEFVGFVFGMCGSVLNVCVSISLSLSLSLSLSRARALSLSKYST